VLRLDGTALSGTGGPGIELALVAVAAPQVAAALALARRLGASAVTLLTDGADPADAPQWAALAERLGLRLLGPGTLGFVRPSIGLNAGRTGAMPAAGQVALVSQSGVLNGAVLDWVADYSVGFSLVVSLGAEAGVDLAQVLDYLSSDAQTRSVVVYLEAVTDARRFMSALRALALVKPVIVLKGHRDDRAPRRSLTHSGAVCSADALYSAALRRAGAVQIGLFTQMFTAARILASGPGPLGTRLAVIANGHGPAALAADQAGFQALRLPDLAEVTLAALARTLPGRALANPLNLGVDATPEHFAQSLVAVAADPGIDGVLVMLAPHGGLDAEGITRRVAEVAGGLHKPLFACWMGDRAMRPLAHVLDACGVPVYPVPEAAIDAWATVARFHQNQRLLQQTPRPLSGGQAPDLAGARALIAAALAAGQTVLDERQSKALLQAFRIGVTRTLLARTLTQALEAARTLGFPLVMKVSAAGIVHKSEVGGVVLNVRSEAEVREQYPRILRAVADAQPQIAIDGITLQPMRQGRHARELYVGVFRDPLFGPVMAFGAGGTRVELLRDTTLEFPPLNGFLAGRMIERTRVADTLADFQGAPAIDPQPLQALLVAVSEMVCELPWIAQMDINPVIADEHGLVAVDARVVLDGSVGAAPPRHAHLAIMPYPSHLTRGYQAPGGRTCTLRAIQAEDADRLQAFIRALSAESRYYRFLSVLAELPQRMLIRYTQIDYDRELALVAVQGAGEDERIVGVVRYLLNPDRVSCEFAVAIADDWQGERLGATLMRAIVDAARLKGLQRIEGYVLATNSRMLGLMSFLGFTRVTDPQDPTLRRVWLDLTAG
jgi:acetyltransferase